MTDLIKISYEQFINEFDNENVDFLRNLQCINDWKVFLHPKYLIPMAVKYGKIKILNWLLENKKNEKLFVKYLNHVYLNRVYLNHINPTTEPMDSIKKSNEH